MIDSIRKFARGAFAVLVLGVLACAGSQKPESAEEKPAPAAKSPEPQKPATATKSPEPQKPATTASSSSSADISAAPKLPVKNYTTVYIEQFTLNPKGVDEDEPVPYMMAAQQSLLSALTNSGMFQSVKPGPTPAGADALVVKAELRSLRIVSAGARGWAGAFAGKSQMKFRVTLVDAKTGASVNALVGQDSNAFGGAWTGGATDRSVPGETGRAIAQYVVFTLRNNH